MAQIDPNTVQWDAPPQPVGKPVTGAKDQPLQGGVILPGKPEKAPQPSPLRETEKWRTMTPQEVAATPGLDQTKTYQINAAGKIEPIGGATGTPKVEPKTAAANLLLSAGVDPVTGLDPVSDLIKGSTSGAVQNWFAEKYGEVTGEATPGMENIAKLKTIVSDMTLQLTGGSLGAGVSNADVTFLKERVGNLADPTRPANERLAAWNEVKQRLQRVTGAAPQAAPAGEIVPPELRVAEGAEYSTDLDFKRQRDSAEAWAATQGMPFDQALTQFNATMQAKGYGPAGQETINVLQWWEQNKPGDRGAVQWELPKTGVREAGAPGAAAAIGSGLISGYTAGLGEEALNLIDPTAAAKLQAIGQYSRETSPVLTTGAEILGGALSPLAKIGPGGTVAGEALRGGIYGGLYGAGQEAPGAGLMERLPGAAIGGITGGAIGGAAQRILGGRLPTASAEEIIPPSAAPEVTAPIAPAVAPEAGMVAEEIVTEAAQMTPQQIGELARQAIGRGRGAAKAKSQLATIAKSNPEAVAAADRLGLELPVDVVSDNAQLRSLTGLARSEVGSEAETAWGETSRAVIQRAQQALDELGGTTDLAQVNADVFKRLDDTQQALGKQASTLREEVEATFSTSQRVEPSAVRDWLKGRIDELGGGKEGLAALSPEEKKLWGAVSKGQPTYARLNEARDMIGQALGKGTGPWSNSNLGRLKGLYGALADDQINFIESTAGKEVADKQRAANTLFNEMYKGREQMQQVFGKDLSRSIVPLMQRAITSGSKGDVTALSQLVSTVPEDMRGTVLVSALFNAAKSRAGARGADEMFSFTNFSKIYRDLRSNNDVYKQVAKAVGPEGDRILTDLYAISRRMADAESRVLKTGKANQALVNSLDAENLISRVVKGAAGRLGAYTVGGLAGGPMGAAAAGGIAEAAQYIGKEFGKDNADKVHRLLVSPEFRDLVEKTGMGEVTTPAVRKLAQSKPFRDYAKSIGLKGGQTAFVQWLTAGTAPNTTPEVPTPGQPQ